MSNRSNQNGETPRIEADISVNEAKGSRNEENCKVCYIYLLEGLADWEIGHITAEINSKRFLSKNKNIILKFVSKDLKPIQTMGGAIFKPDRELSRVKFKIGDMLLLPGSDSWDNVHDESLINIVKNLDKGEITISAICGAINFLANIGILNDRKHTGNDLNYLKMVCPNYAGSSLFLNQSVVVSEKLITASGLAPLDFSYEILKKLDLMKDDTLEAWYNLYNLKDPEYFFPLMNSL